VEKPTRPSSTQNKFKRKPPKKTKKRVEEGRGGRRSDSGGEVWFRSITTSVERTEKYKVTMRSARAKHAFNHAVIERKLEQRI